MLLAFEEAIGFMLGTAVKDKDGVWLPIRLAITPLGVNQVIKRQVAGPPRLDRSSMMICRASHHGVSGING